MNALRSTVHFETTTGEKTTPEQAMMVITRTFNADGKQVSVITQTGDSWREEREVGRNGCW